MLPPSRSPAAAWAPPGRLATRRLRWRWRWRRFPSLVPQRFDGVELRRLERRVEAERDAHQGGEEESERDGLRLHGDRPAGEAGHSLLDTETEEDAERAASDRE